MKVLTEEQRLARNEKARRAWRIRNPRAAKTPGTPAKRQTSDKYKRHQCEMKKQQRDAAMAATLADRIARHVKRCWACKTEKPEAGFTTWKGKRLKCDTCDAIQRQKEQEVAKNKRYLRPGEVRSEAGKLAFEAFREYHNARGRQRYQTPQGRQSHYAASLKHNFGITPSDVGVLFFRQAGRCRGCHATLDMQRRVGAGRANTHVDHCHGSGAVRGLLCAKCNVTLGNVGDSAVVLENLAAYLRDCPSSGPDHNHEYPRHWGEEQRRYNEKDRHMGDVLTRDQIYQKMAQASASSTGVNLLDGRGRLAIKKFNVDNGYNGSRVVVDAIICSNQKIHVQDIVTHQVLDITPNPPGSEVNLVYMVGKHVAAFGALKSLVLAIYDEKAEDNTDEQLIDCMRTLCEQNAAYGRVVDYTTVRKLTVERKVQMVNPKWEAVKQSEVDVAAMQKWMDSLKTGAAVTA